jgi:hypothetical protein
MGMSLRPGKKKLWLGGLLLALVLGGGFFFIKWANTPSRQTITVESQAQSPKPDYVKLDTIYFSSVNPQAWQVRQQTNQGRLQVQTFAKSANSGQMAIVVDTLPAEGLAGVGDYNLRIRSPDQYEIYTNDGLPSGTKAFKNKTSSPVYTVFMTNNSRYASITISEMTSVETTLTLMHKVTAQWVWK